MATFLCRYATAGGRILIEDREADSPDRLRRQLEAEGYYVFHVVPRTTASRVRSSIPVRSRPIRKKDLLILNQEFLALIRSGLPILPVLDLVIERQAHPRLRQVLLQVREAVKGGASLSEAVERHPDVFPALYVASLRVGERSGELPETLARYIAHLKRAIGLQKRVTQALFYPAILLGLTTAVVIFLLSVVVPSFSQIYLDFEAELPYPTQLLLATTGLVREHLLTVFPIPVLGVFALWQFRRTNRGRLGLDRLLLRLPLPGDVLDFL